MVERAMVPALSWGVVLVVSFTGSSSCWLCEEVLGWDMGIIVELWD